MHRSLYQINTRVWLRRFGENTLLNDVPDRYWAALAERGIDYVWLMGVWRARPELATRYGLEPGLRRAYSRALPDWSEPDLIGSPYAIDRYELAPMLGQAEDLPRLRERLNGHGLRLILDFVPNHFHAESSLIGEQADVFLQADERWLQHDPATFYRLPDESDLVLAHGKDPNFAAWRDTVQVNYAHPAAHDFMGRQLLALTEVCDGLRCDMAMLPVPEVFLRTWGFLLGSVPMVIKSFWPDAIAAVREKRPDFTFLAEVYWDMEWELQQQGFDYTYDKRLLDRLLKGEVEPIRRHFLAAQAFQHRSARFLENHDEDRILSEVDERHAQAAAVLTYTCPGLRFFHDGQWEGRRVRVPVQLGREPKEPRCACIAGQLPALGNKEPLPAFEPLCTCTTRFYLQLLELLSEPVFRQGEWEMVDLLPWQDDDGRHVIAWRWTLGEDQRLVVVNYTEQTTYCRLPAAAGEWEETFSGGTYPADENGLRLQLYPYQYLLLRRKIIN